MYLKTPIILDLVLSMKRILSNLEGNSILTPVRSWLTFNNPNFFPTFETKLVTCFEEIEKWFAIPFIYRIIHLPKQIEAVKEVKQMKKKLRKK